MCPNEIQLSNITDPQCSAGMPDRHLLHIISDCSGKRDISSQFVLVTLGVRNSCELNPQPPESPTTSMSI